jgi:uncharacterized protein
VATVTRMTGTLKERLRADLTTSMKARDDLRRATLRMVLTAITNAEVAGDTARELSDAETVAVLQREVKKRAESAEAYASGGRPELAERERAESAVITHYLPRQLSDDEIAELAQNVVAELTEQNGEKPGGKQLGAVIKALQARTAGQADGRRISEAARSALNG